MLGDIGLLQIVVSEQMFKETERNLRDKSPSALAAFSHFRKTIAWAVVPYPSRDHVAETAQHIASKDAPILAAAMDGKVNRLLTLDVRHFKTEAVLNYSKLIIQTPGEFMLEIRYALSETLKLDPK